MIRLSLRILIFAAFTLAATAMQACSDVKLSMPSGVMEYRSLFGPLKPALAVRNTACIMCHAKIDGDLVSDFGYGNQFFMGTDKLINHPQQTAYYGPFVSKHFIYGDIAWNASSIMGDVYIPNVNLNDPRLINAHFDPAAGNGPVTTPLKLLDFIENPFKNLASGNVISVIGRTNDPDINNPGLRGQFIARKRIWIDAPTEPEILSLQQLVGAQKLFAQLGVVVYKRGPYDFLSGLIAQQSSATFRLYLTNGPTMTCRGDIIIQGSVFLNNLKLDTDGNGCRLYVTGTVFIQGPITYVRGGNSNLQISSSRAIVMGMRALSTRITQSATPLIVGGIRQGWTDDEELAFMLPIANDRDSMDGLTNDAGPFRKMTDLATGNVIAVMDDYDLQEWAPAPGYATYPDPASCDWSGTPAPGVKCSISWAEGYGRKSIDYSHILLNAPKVYSRYYGTFEGVVIAEDALFAVNNFVFKHDPVLDKVNLLPLVQDRIFEMTED